ncbi:MAG: hypothetical protein OXI15_14070 [Chromatiales bacterium]|nr:hypothetical protein [Chromatiales bacterium]
MTNSQRLLLKQSEKRERVNALLAKDELTGEERTELDTLTGRLQEIEGEYRAAVTVEQADLEAEQRAAGNVPDAEMRERIELRGRARLTNFITAALRGRLPEGAERELAEAAGVDGIPLELWDAPEERAVAAVPGTVGVNLDPIRPQLFAPSIAPRLGIEMPRVPSGTYATATITTGQSAAGLAKSAAAAGVAGAITAQTTTPHRVSARLEVTLEDIASVGVANFEAALRQNLSSVLSDQLDDYAINGSGTDPIPGGILAKLTDPTAGTAVADFDAFVAAFAGGIDGLWASTMKEVAIVAGVDTYKLSAAAFRDKTIGTDKGISAGDMTFADYAMMHTGGWWTNKRMPAASSDNQAAILYRMGRPGVRKAVCPHWGAISIDDMYTGSAKAERYFTMHVLVGDVLLVQPDAYSELTFHLA